MDATSMYIIFCNTITVIDREQALNLLLKFTLREIKANVAHIFIKKEKKKMRTNTQ